MKDFNKSKLTIKIKEKKTPEVLLVQVIHKLIYNKKTHKRNESRAATERKHTKTGHTQPHFAVSTNKYLTRIYGGARNSLNLPGKLISPENLAIPSVSNISATQSKCK